MASKTTIKIKITEGFHADKAIKKFKRLCDQFGIVKEYRKREAYKKPSVKEKEKRESAEKRRRKTEGRFGKFSRKI